MDPSLLRLVSSFLGDNTAAAEETPQPPSSRSASVKQKHKQKQNPRFHVVIFSKDRPWQLQQLLFSMKLEDIQEAQTTVIAKVQPLFRSGYQQVMSEFGSVNFLLESLEGTFNELLDGLIQPHAEDDNLRWMFLTDDCLLVAPLEQIAMQSVASDIFLPRLHPAIYWCQTRNLPSPPPRHQLRYCHASNSFEYNLSCGQIDWAYPWDLSGGIYRNDLVQGVLGELDAESASHPNKLEVAGHAVLRKRKSLRVFIPPSPAVLVLAINRVQDICRAPIANQMDPSDLLPFLDEGRRLDIEAYRESHFNSSHISQIVLQEDKQSITCDLSVLLPCHTGPPVFARAAIRSVVLQRKLPISRMQLVVVDDRCSDGSIDSMVEAATEAAKEVGCSLMVADNRQGSRTAVDCDLILDIYSSPTPGVAAALNYGLQRARYEFVARMDADDYCVPGRFSRQFKFLCRNPAIAVVGTHSLLFSKDNKTNEVLRPNESRAQSLPFSEINETLRTRPSLPPTDPGFVSWAMLFSCCLSHPSVMYRKTKIVNAGGYRENAMHAEDYDLWLRLTSQDPLSTTSLPFLGVWHRKHPTNSGKKGKQQEEAHSLACKAINNLVQGTGSDAVKYLRQPDLGRCKADLDSAADLMLRLRDSFLYTHQAEISEREIGLIKHDSKERLGQIATISISKFGENSIAFKLWCRECPDNAMEQIALLCNAQGMRSS